MYKVKRATAGLGLFTEKQFARGERIVEYKGERLLVAQTKSNAKYLMAMEGDMVINGKGRHNVARYINHSCKPNAEAIIEDGVFIYARRRIQAGDEITIDYGKDYWDTYIAPKGCKCSSCSEHLSAETGGRVTT